MGAPPRPGAVVGNSAGRIAVAADYLLGGELTASRRQPGSAGRNAASGRNVGQVCANGAATKLHRWFSGAPLTKCRCSEIVLGDPNTRYGKPLTRLTGPEKTREMAIKRASRDWRDPAAMAEVALWGGKRGGGRVRVSVCLFRAGTWLTAWPGHKCAQCTSRSARRACSGPLRRAGPVTVSPELRRWKQRSG